jgi:Rieske 2Fe-2S family protein
VDLVQVGVVGRLLVRGVQVAHVGAQRAAELGRPIMTIDDGPETSHLRLIIQRTLREGYETETPDGTPASCLMGKRKDWDQGRMHLSFSPVNHIVADNDFAVLFFFTPRGPMETDVELIWLVDSKAQDYDVEKLTWAWDVTTKQDKTITEDNQAGIMSSRYAPGRYSDQERGVVTFQQWYLRHFGRPVTA